MSKWLGEASDLTGEVALILDLGFHGESELVWPTVAAAMETISADLKIDDLPPDDQWDGLACACHLVDAAPGITRLLVLVASGRYSADEAAKIATLLNGRIAQKGKSLTHKVEFAFRKLADSTGAAKDVLNTVAETWAKSFDLHPDDFVNRTLSTFLSPWVTPYKYYGQKHSWCHECLDSSGTEYFARLRVLLPALNDTESAKGLIMLATDVATTTPSWDDAWTRLIAVTDGRPMQQPVLRQVLELLGIPSDGIASESYWRMPVVPGLPFLLSLGQLASAIRKDADTRILWQKQKDYFQLTFTLQTQRLKGGVMTPVGPRDLELKYKRELAAGNLKGVCLALNNALYCRLVGLNEVMAMLGIFSGSGLCAPVVTLRFDDYKVAMIWPCRPEVT